MIHEMGKMLEKKTLEVKLILAYIFAPIFLFAFKNFDSDFILLSFILYVLILLLIELFSGKASAILNVAGGILLLFYPIAFIGSILAIRELYPIVFKADYYDGAYFIFMIFLSIWACDIFAYFGGKLFGKHKLFPRVSPKKSIEGAVFGFVFAIILAITFQMTVLSSLPLWKAIILAIVVGIFGQIGDLIESLFKRDAAIKDSGQTIPGHGGILDRLDSVLYVAPIILILLYASKF